MAAAAAAVTPPSHTPSGPTAWEQRYAGVEDLPAMAVVGAGASVLVTGPAGAGKTRRLAAVLKGMASTDIDAGGSGSGSSAGIDTANIVEITATGIYATKYTNGDRAVGLPWHALGKGRTGVALIRHLDVLLKDLDLVHRMGKFIANPPCGWMVAATAGDAAAVPLSVLHAFTAVVDAPLPALRGRMEITKRVVLAHERRRRRRRPAAAAPTATPTPPAVTPAGDARSAGGAGDDADALAFAAWAAGRLGGVGETTMLDIVHRVLHDTDFQYAFAERRRRARIDATPTAKPSEGENAGGAIQRVPEGGKDTKSAGPAAYWRLARRVFDDIAARTCGYAGRGAGAEIPSVKWDDLVGHDAELGLLKTALSIHRVDPDVAAQLALTPCAGVLLYGLPGNGKTMLAKAVATELGAAFLPAAIPDLLKPYVGESERAVRELFAGARRNAPCCVFLDEVQAIFGHRNDGGDGGGGGTSHDSRVVSQLLAEFDALPADVFVLAATNVPSALDPSLLSSNRLSLHIHVRPPTLADRRAFLTSRVASAAPLEVEEVACRTEGYSYSDLVTLVHVAHLQGSLEAAARVTHASSTKEMLLELERWRP